jgi:hypothetical protein
MWGRGVLQEGRDPSTVVQSVMLRYYHSNLFRCARKKVRIVLAERKQICEVDQPPCEPGEEAEAGAEFKRLNPRGSCRCWCTMAA